MEGLIAGRKCFHCLGAGDVTEGKEMSDTEVAGLRARHAGP
jgi:hypothetical protein